MPPTVSSGRAAVGLRDVLSGGLDAVLGRRNALGLPRRDAVVVVLVDGLGAEALAARAGHARTLTGSGAGSGRSAKVATGCPTTTAAALATLATGADPGEHGVLAYSALDPAADRVVNQLRGFDDDLPPGWQRRETVFERALAESVRAFATGPRHYAGSGFTREVLRGADYLGARTIESRFATALEAVRAGGPALGYLYVPELDTVAHREGWSSPAWTADLEEVDAAVAATVPALRQGETLLVTADHGILDVPPDRHVLVDEMPGLLDGVRHIAGEPRLLHVHLEPDRDPMVAAAIWRTALGGAADVLTRAEAVAGGWFGTTVQDVLPRIGDLLVAARGRTAFYDGRSATGRGMVGQHGSWSTAERFVPLLRFDG